MASGIIAASSGAISVVYTPPCVAKIMLTVSATGIANVSVNGISGALAAGENVFYLGAFQPLTVQSTGGASFILSSLEELE